MGTYVLRRVLQMIPVIIGTTFLIYWMVFSLGDPTVGRCGERPCPEAYVARIHQEYNLDKPLPEQYVRYMAKVAQGDLGTSFNGNEVIDQLGDRWPVTLKLATIAIVFEAIIGIAAGLLAGLRRRSFWDSLVFVSTLVIISIPSFVLGSVAQMVFGVQLSWFPVTATQGTWEQLLLPGFVLGSLSMAYIARLTRNSLSENLSADYVRTAKAKGLSSGRVVGVHTFRNSLIPVVTFIGATSELDGRRTRHGADLQHPRHRRLHLPLDHDEGRHGSGRHHHPPGAGLPADEPDRRPALRSP